MTRSRPEPLPTAKAYPIRGFQPSGFWGATAEAIRNQYRGPLKEDAQEIFQLAKIAVRRIWMVRASATSSVAAARRKRIDLAVTSVKSDPDVVYDPTEWFSGAYMQAFFRQARSSALSGRLWQA